MGCPVQIEFAVNLASKAKKQSEFYFLQIRPMIGGREYSQVIIEDVDQKFILCRTSDALGNGLISDISDIVYVKPEKFDASRTIEIAGEIGKLNSELAKLGRKYILIGPGRWGTADSWLGIPVTWDQISNVRVIVETDLDGYAIEPSQGTHFFHNLTSFQIAYFCIRLNKKDDYIAWDWLNQQPAISETKFLRHISLPSSVEVKIDGRSRQGIILKPKYSSVG